MPKLASEVVNSKSQYFPMLYSQAPFQRQESRRNEFLLHFIANLQRRSFVALPKLKQFESDFE